MKEGTRMQATGSSVGSNGSHTQQERKDEDEKTGGMGTGPLRGTSAFCHRRELGPS